MKSWISKLLRHSLVTRRFSLHELPDHRRRPNAYSGLASRSVNAILKRSYAPLAEKLPSVVSRLRKASALIRQAPQQLDAVSGGVGGCGAANAASHD